MKNCALSIGLKSAILTSSAIVFPAPLLAQTMTVFHFDMPAQPLDRALRQVARKTGAQIMFAPAQVSGLNSPRLQGDMGAEEAVRRLLAGTDLTAEKSASAIVIRGRLKTADGDSEQQRASSNDIVVTGSRIYGVPVASSVNSITRGSMENAGQASLGEVARSIPQSFGGGQNPGIGTNVPSASGVDVGGASSINLRGLGSDATLTLLNGHRIPYAASRQSVDVSAIPLGIVDRIEIVADGASALYGSDAVAGVANIILRRDFQGFETGARIGRSTDGGNFNQQYTLTAGGKWAEGGAIVAYDHGQSSAIWGRQRSYATDVAPNLMLYPELRHDSVAMAGHQAIASSVTLDFDGFYNVRSKDSIFPVVSRGVVGQAELTSKDRIYGLSSSIKAEVGGGWQISVVGTYGREKVDYAQSQCFGASCSSSGSGYYKNDAHSVEFSGNGRLLSLPAGDVKVALGGGYRSITFERFNGVGSALNTQHGQDSYYSYGELNLPLASPVQGRNLLYRVNVNAALRYERYPGIGSVATPKLGAVYSPSPDLDFKASWGKSFRAPTLYQQYQPRNIYLYPASAVGAKGYPPTSAVLLILGGNPSLKPEKATSWSGTIAAHPRFLSGAKLEVSYFHIDYRDRIVSPIALVSQALSNPIYQSQIALAPDIAAQQAAIADAATFLNATAYPYNPVNVLAIVNNGNLNAGHQIAHGVDVLATYDCVVGRRDRASVSANISYLSSKQQLSVSQPEQILAGYIFNPPHWRGQASATWNHDDLTLNATINYIGSVRDVRFAPPPRVHALTTLDVTARYELNYISSFLQKVRFIVSVQNIANAKPDRIAVTNIFDTPYDSTNYSPIGRAVSVGLNAKW